MSNSLHWCRSFDISSQTGDGAGKIWSSLISNGYYLDISFQLFLELKVLCFVFKHNLFYSLARGAVRTWKL